MNEFTRLDAIVKRIAESTVRRLSIYLRFLEEFEVRGSTTVSSEERSIRRYIEMHRPFTTFQVIPNTFSGRDVVTGQPKHLTLWRLQVVPNPFAVAAKKLMAFYLHVHCATVNLG